jgi:hypothetical protein
MQISQNNLIYMKKLKSFDNFIAEGELPSWAKPEANPGNMDFLVPNYTEYRDKKQAMSRFSVGDTVSCTKDGAKCMGMTGEIVSMESGKWITFRVPDGSTYEIEPEYLVIAPSPNIQEITPE